MRVFSIILLIAVCGPVATAQAQSPPNPATLTLIGYDSLTGELGVAVASQRIASGAVVPAARGGIAALAITSSSQPSSASVWLGMIAGGASSRQSLDSVSVRDPAVTAHAVGAVDGHGISFARAGDNSRSLSGAVAGDGYCVLAENLPTQPVLAVMVSAYREAGAGFPERLLKALETAAAASGLRYASAALLVVTPRIGYGPDGDRFVDLRVDDDSLPLVRLRRLFGSWSAVSLDDAGWRIVDDLNAQRQFDAAREALKRIVAGLNEELRRHPDDPTALARIARQLAVHDVDAGRALELALRAEKMSPADPDILDAEAECYFHLKRYDDAIATASRTVAIDPSNEYYQNQLQKFRAARQQGR